MPLLFFFAYLKHFELAVYKMCYIDKAGFPYVSALTLYMHHAYTCILFQFIMYDRLVIRAKGMRTENK